LENISEIYKVIIGLLATGILMIPVVFFYNNYTKRKRTNMIDKIAVSINKMYQNLIVTDFELISVYSSEFKELDLHFYESISAYLESRNFTLIGDFEESHMRKTIPNVQYFKRLMVDSDTEITATIYHLKMGKSSLRIIELKTEFTNGTFLITTNNVFATNIEYPKEIIIAFFKTDNIKELLENHKNRQQQIAESDKTGIMKVIDISGIIDQNKRENSITNNFRNFIGKNDIIKEVKRICPKTVDSKAILEIADRIIELKSLKKIA
jgi:hypothetical protein